MPTPGSGRLSGRRMLITGAASGIGEAVADLFADEGASLVLTDLDDARLTLVATRVGQHHVPCDLRDHSAIERMVGAGADALGGLDGVVNAAGVLVNRPFWEFDGEDLTDILSVNLIAPFLVCRYALPHLRAADTATIVNISSMVGLRAREGLSAYSATKAGLLRLTEAIGMEAGPKVRANAICPGMIRTPMSEHMFASGAVNDESAARRMSLERPGTPAEVARAALFLSTDESSFMTKWSINVDGGQRGF